jgi:hypothetical protein
VSGHKQLEQLVSRIRSAALTRDYFRLGQDLKIHRFSEEEGVNAGPSSISAVPKMRRTCFSAITTDSAVVRFLSKNDVLECMSRLPPAQSISGERASGR